MFETRSFEAIVLDFQGLDLIIRARLKNERVTRIIAQT
jgi:hypothetical protein